jgi:O-antigen/teichoic acid export membrane protein
MYNLRKDILFSIITQLALMLIALVINKLLSINLTVSDYGEFNIVKRASTVASFTMLAGMGIAIPKYIPQSKNNQEKMKFLLSAFILIIFISLVVLFFVFILKKSINRYVFNNSDFVAISYCYACSIALLSFLYSYYRGFNKIISFNLVQILIQFSVLLITIFYSSNFLLYLWLNIIVSILFFIFFIYYDLRNHFISILSFSIKELYTYIKELWSFGYSRMMGDFLLFSLTTLPLLIINFKFGSIDSAYFSVAITLTSMISPIFSYIGVILLPKVSQAISENKISDIISLVNKFLLMYVLFSLLVIVIIYFFDDMLIRLFFSKSYLQSKDILIIISFSILPNSIYLLLRNPIDAFSKTPYNTYNLVLSSTIGFIVMFWSKNLVEISKAYVLLQFLLGTISFFIWQKLKIKKNV